ncbi:MAG TPA: hypothetical protein VFV38_15525 [Ktedonobacteraceae bacterium]|nr:hypothetical protein [Ktedonobacteraceae bacterium]
MKNVESFNGVEHLCELGFTLSQIEQLNRLRSVYIEREQKQILAEQRRLEFARWLVSTGRLTDELPVKRRRGSRVLS